MSSSSSLDMLIGKEPVVATHVGIFEPEVARQTLARYGAETETFVLAPDIQRYQREFIHTVLDRKTAIACLVAPFGYGKTSTAINIWQACDDAGLLAVPPFSCNSVAEMGQAIATALVYRLTEAGNRHAAERVQSAYRGYLVSSVQRLAEQDAARYAITYDAALASIQDKVQNGYLQLEASGTHLIGFLERLVAIALDAGYKGLVVIVDEFQQFLGNINKAVITNFRTLIWGLRTRGALPLGFLITLDPDTERNLMERGADILHRIRKDGLYLAFASIYDREFPRGLWSRYAETFGFIRESARIVDNATLDAIGQLCERADLSNGPRTVISVFQRIAALYSQRQRPYTPIDLVDDFLTGDIRFNGDQAKIASLVNELTSYDYIRRSPKRVATIKLIAAFPRGCPQEVAARYGLGQPFRQLADELRGEILVELPEGMALVDLQKVGKPQNKLNVILRKYWMQITEAEIIADRALVLFADYVAKPLFSQYVSFHEGWQERFDHYQLTSTGGYIQLYEGTFFEEYPQRVVAVQVCSRLEDAVRPAEHVDAHLVFLVQTAEGPAPATLPASLNNPQTLIVHIPIHQPLERQLPRDLREIGHFLSPVVLTPGVLVSLLNYVDEQTPHIEGISEGERQRIEDTKRRLQEFLLAMIFGSEQFARYNMTIYSRGAQAIRDALYQVFRTSYPDYQTLMTSPAWKKLLAQYARVMQQIGGAQRRGLEPLADSKAQLASLFDQRQYAGFESYARQFSDLLEITDWHGSSGALVFRRHPQETRLLEAISVARGLTAEEVGHLSRGQGYREEETAFLVDFLFLRGYIERVPGTDRLVPAQTLSAEELAAIGHEALQEAQFVQAILGDVANDALCHQIESLVHRLQAGQEALSDAQVRLMQCQRMLQQRRLTVIQHLRQRMLEKIEQLYASKARLSEPLATTATGLSLDNHINGAQRVLDKNRQRVCKRIEKQAAAMRTAAGASLDVLSATFQEFQQYIHRLHQHMAAADKEASQYRPLLELLQTHQQWVELVGRIKRIQDSLDVAIEITDTSGLRQHLERLVLQIQQELASEGLKQFQSIYNRFEPAIREIQSESDTLVSLATRRREVKVALSADGCIRFRRNGSGDVDLRETLHESHLSPQQFLERLIALAEQGAIVIQERNPDA